jgi:hypothetical protein
MDIAYTWRGDFGNAEVNALHAEAFDTKVYDESEWNWRDLVRTVSPDAMLASLTPCLPST